MEIKLKYVVQSVPFTLTNSQYRDVKGGRFDNKKDAEKMIEQLCFDDMTVVGRNRTEYRIDVRYEPVY